MAADADGRGFDGASTNTDGREFDATAAAARRRRSGRRRVHAVWRRGAPRRAILSRILKDEAAHGTFGLLFLDWAAPLLKDSDRERLAQSADLALRAVASQWDEIRARPPSAACDGNPLAWLDTDQYLKLAARSMNQNVLRPLREYGIPIRSFPEGVRTTRSRRLKCALDELSPRAFPRRGPA